MIVAGVMSGTSADGINVAFVRCRGRGLHTRFALLAHEQYSYTPALRKKILSLMNAASAHVADLARLNFLLGELYAEAILKARRTNRIPKLDLVGCHGQTLYHQSKPALFLNHPIACTWQTGEAAVVAARVGAPVVSDFRPADMAAGGKGAPLVPFLDYLLFRHPRRGRILQNLGGIGNLTAIPAGAKAEQVIAFDTGPGNMVIDAVTQQLFGQPFDRNGKIAAQGRVLETIVNQALRGSFFQQEPPRTAGREQFGRQFAQQFMHWCKKNRKASVRKVDIVATATALTAASIQHALQRYVMRPNSFQEFIVSGGGAKNRTLMHMIQERLSPLKLKLKPSDDFGIPSEAKEAIAFALLAYQTWHRQPGNIPSATGAKRAAILGKISFP
ncbi:MAG TPA: anhydro-N-acetylmuramic acid kinase [Terriglobales bacterium]|jgi:anhydro-N-acetylmuramic acid kinase|nr:anhydro-N-acetylmuramic acid kinase [Terriglobales bacterium]